MKTKASKASLSKPWWDTSSATQEDREGKIWVQQQKGRAAEKGRKEDKAYGRKQSGDLRGHSEA